MLGYGEVKEHLDAARKPGWTQKRIKAITKWPGPNRKRLLSLTKPLPGLHRQVALEECVDKAKLYFEELDTEQCRNLWEGLFPNLAPHAERAWRDSPSQPYHHAFRATHRVDMAAEARARYFVLLCEHLRDLNPDVEWLAAWAPYLHCIEMYSDLDAWLLAAVLSGGGPDAAVVRAVLTDSINGEHPIGIMGRHVVVALLNSSERSDWEIIGNLLVAARRQEGLRQAILEAVDVAHPAAFRYMLGVIIEHDLARFSATVRAFDVWLGMQWAGGSVKVVNMGVNRLIEFFDDDSVREKAIADGEPEDAYLALWVTAYGDADQAVKLAAPLLEEPSVERRFVALYTIGRIALYPESLVLLSSRLISGAETDPRLQMATVDFLSGVEYETVPERLFDATAKLLEQLPKTKRKLDPIVWPWAQYALDRRAVAGALYAMAKATPQKLIPYAHTLDSGDCVDVIQELAGTGEYWDGVRHQKRKPRKLTSEARKLMLVLVGDTRQVVQRAAFEALARTPVENDEVEVLLGLLHRTAATLRAGAIERLSKLPDKRAMEVIAALISDGNPKKCAAGLEIATYLVESKRSAKQVRKVLSTQREAPTEPEQIESMQRLLGGEAEAVSYDDCLGLVPPHSRSTLPAPKFAGVKLETKAARACLRELADLFLQHGETEIEVKDDSSTKRVLLASAGWDFPEPDQKEDALADAKQRLPLCDIWLDWLSDRPDATRDPDGLELVRAWAWRQRGDSYRDLLPAPFRESLAWEINSAFDHLLEWMLMLSAPKGGAEMLVQYFEDALAKDSPSTEERKEGKEDQHYAAYEGTAARRLRAIRRYLTRRPSDDPGNCRQRLCLLGMIASERALLGCEPGPSLELFVAAYDSGLLNEHDFLWLLLNPREFDRSWGSKISFGPIREVSGLRVCKTLTDRPRLQEAVEKARARLIELELMRGERSTLSSIPAGELRNAGGADVLFRLIAALGRDKIVRQHEWGDLTRAFSFSRLIFVTFPGDEDTHERFGQLFASSGMKPARLLEIAMFAPQWAWHVQHALDVPDLEEAVWWIHAHTKESAYWRGSEIRDLWAARISELTELEADDLEEGAVDVKWFRRIIDIVGPAGWDRLQKPAKYASNSGGHKRAQLFAGAMLSNVTTVDLLARIDEKRHQDSVRALGLVPLPKKAAESQAETLLRYKRLQEFTRESRKFGSQRQASEGRAVSIGLQNLARTAGYRDPRRLQWAMEAEAVADLVNGPVSVAVDETTVTLAITSAGDPELTVVKNGRPLKSVPAKLRKNEQIAGLRSRVTELRRQRSRMRLSLEESMCRGDEFTGSELKEFLAHPMLRAMVERLIFVGNGELIGYPDKNGNVLRSHDGALEAIGSANAIRIAHPVDLLERGEWSAWQRACFAAEIVQPFKQVFRETYPKTASELDACDFTRRYAGHQVNPNQAISILKRRQWVVAPEEGVRKTFHDEDLVAEVWFQEHFYTPAEIEDLTLEGIAFVKRRATKYRRLPISEIPARLFSETMRDLDLVVSVAHSGGIDPEASASTVEMRATLVKETCQLLRLSNVQVDGHHVRIDGKLGSYSVHLGSATTMVLPGRMLLIVAVHSQYRGRLFLPFADDDPKTAEVLSKTLLLARDEEIKDPSIIQQIIR